MSPEQARGKPLDKRTDIWSFGCCLYEALSGRAVFLGETISDTTGCRRATISVTSSTLCRSNLVINSPTTRSSSPLGKAVAVDEAIELAMKIAEALENAHEQGIVHRDLKPANSKITPDGNVKVLDFGLAKAFIEDAPDADSSMSPTLTRDATRAGVILGTAAYMSPEQAKGKKVDKRADVWAFGAVVYEMLTGKRAFAAEDVSDTLAYVWLRKRIGMPCRSISRRRCERSSRAVWKKIRKSACMTSLTCDWRCKERSRPRRHGQPIALQ